MQRETGTYMPGEVDRDEYDFKLTTVRYLDARPEELTEVGLDPEQLDKWCSNVFMFGEVVDRGAADGLGMTMRLHVKGFLPHSFFIVVRIIDVIQHKYMRVAVTGDLEGIGDVTLIPDGAGCQWHLDWRMSITRGWMRPLGRIFHRPMLWNHKWAMNQAARLVVDEVHRRRAAADGRIAEPRATFPHNLMIVRHWQRRRAAGTRWRS